MKKIGVLTSGGDSPGMNAAIRAVVRACAYHKIACVGIKLGLQGLIDDVIVDMDARSVKHIIHRGGTVLKTARSAEFRTVEGRKKAAENVRKHQIDGLVIIGGDGSFTGGHIFHQEHGIPFVGVPGTIDNDIFGTDFTIGYDTALNTVIDALDKIRDTATSHNRVFFVEVMGRDAGFIALSSGIAAGAQEILIPEKKDRMEDLFESLQHAQEKGKASCIVVVGEGETLGNIYQIAEQTQTKFPDYEVRVTVLGHIQRGGTPSCADRVLASRLGVGAVDGLLAGRNDVMAGIRANQLVYTPIEEAIKKHNDIDPDLLRVAKILSV